MSTTKHTPGPWSGGKEVFLRTVELEAVGLSLLFGSFRTEEAKANAHLIAAAPDLYSVAADVVSVLEKDFRLSGRDDDYIYDELGSSLSSLYFAARLAATKARGEL